MEAGVVLPQRNLLGSGWSWIIGTWGHGDHMASSYPSSYSLIIGHLFLVLSQLTSTFAFSSRGFCRDWMMLLLYKAEMILWRGSLGWLQKVNRDEELAHLRTSIGLTMNVILMLIVWRRVDARSCYLSGKHLFVIAPWPWLLSNQVRYAMGAGQCWSVRW